MMWYVGIRGLNMGFISRPYRIESHAIYIYIYIGFTNLYPKGIC